MALCFAAISHLSGTLRKQKTYCLWSVINRFWSILFLFFKPVGCFPDHDWRQPKSQWLVWFPIQSFCVSWSGRKHLTNDIKHNWIDNISSQYFKHREDGGKQLFVFTLEISWKSNVWYIPYDQLKNKKISYDSVASITSKLQFWLMFFLVTWLTMILQSL